MPFCLQPIKKKLQMSLICYTWDNIKNLIILLFILSLFYSMHKFIICHFVSKLFSVEIIQAFTNLKPYLYQNTIIYRTHKINLWNKEPGHSAQEALSISALFVGTYEEFSNLHD